MATGTAIRYDQYTRYRFMGVSTSPSFPIKTADASPVPPTTPAPARPTAVVGWGCGRVGLVLGGARVVPGGGAEGRLAGPGRPRDAALNWDFASLLRI